MDSPPVRQQGPSCYGDRPLPTDHAMKRPIDFLIIGAQKAGTTSLFDVLAQHQDIFVPDVKEVLYFTHDEFHRQGPGYLAPYYRKHNGQALLGGAHVHIMYFPHAAERVLEHNPAMKVIALLRNPIDRAYSAYWFARRTGWESLETFEEALDLEPSRSNGSLRERAELSYLAHGHYCEQIQRFVDTLGRAQVRVLLTEEFREDPRSTISDTCAWLGVSNDTHSLSLEQDLNVSGLPRSATLQRLLRADDSWLKRSLRRLTPAPARHAFGTHVRRPLLQANIRPFRYPPMAEATRDRLRDYYAPHNAGLAQLLGRNLDHWT
ncbi:MAG TPA: hypothetical protein DIU15_14280 [Deltaproteobacteria bacterium]|nr:hypothetical protein [Deltaproteobacteria bacterium]